MPSDLEIYSVGTPIIIQDLPEIMGRHPPFLGMSTKTLIAAKDDSTLTDSQPSWRRRENGVRNTVFLSAIRVWEMCHLTRRRTGRIFVRILQESRGPIHHFWGAPI